jgi:hypothetical protein
LLTETFLFSFVLFLVFACLLLSFSCPFQLPSFVLFVFSCFFLFIFSCRFLLPYYLFSCPFQLLSFFFSFPASFFLPVSQKEASSNERNKVAVKNAYDRFLKPFFNAARAKGLISSVPQLTTAISEGFRLNTIAKDKRGNPYLAPLLIKFSDKTFRSAIFLCKREVLASLKEEGGSIPIIVEDLTGATLAKMKELKDDEGIEKVWTTEGAIRFTLVADPEKVRKFPGAFTPISEAIK